MPSSAPRGRSVPAAPGGDGSPASGAPSSAPSGGLRRGGPAHLRDSALVAVFAALLAVLSVLPGVQLSFGVPITLGLLGVLLAGLLLGPWRGAAACLLYLLVGLVGLPVFAGGASGPAPFAGPSGGYLIGYPLGALAAGAVVRAGARRGWHRTVPWLLLAGVAGAAVVHAVGVPGLARASAALSLPQAAALDLAFVPGDLLKAVVAALVAAVVHRARPELLGGRRR